MATGENFFDCLDHELELLWRNMGLVAVQAWVESQSPNSCIEAWMFYHGAFRNGIPSWVSMREIFWHCEDAEVEFSFRKEGFLRQVGEMLRYRERMQAGVVLPQLRSDEQLCKSAEVVAGERKNVCLKLRR